ncbi:MAG: 5-formyltetrahydrofolate cyclo-ligase [Prevotella sp.]|nr:5-formyltetrahydrofolate cyclo-ligase [Prevotella sp.]MCI6448528.1 5-formyltetrahydrofolate cyclo-ligase [Prevotella sp.]MCI6805621.1 5-formyltetrahydrofolate cyclo-ligase [Prevotella sp.]MCI7270501.1 5-formyltetrahydrofolate cyclo-ligase [Prevotella sp.]MDD7069144.1 5-formyltetrahydrofolate cyclo-ligase [Prevotella sp.]
MEKKELRRHIRAEKQKYSKAELAQFSAEIVQVLLRHPRVIEAQTILLYHALPDEVDTTALLSALQSQGKTLLLPKVISDTDMTIHRYHGEETLRKDDSFGIMEPDNAPFTDYSSIDLMIIPGMAFDNQCHRLGRGKGYYDRFLSKVPADKYKLGVCFPFQMLPEVPSEATDILMNEVVSGGFVV